MTPGPWFEQAEKTITSDSPNNHRDPRSRQRSSKICAMAHLLLINGKSLKAMAPLARDGRLESPLAGH
jgi:hypothetical protein